MNLLHLSDFHFGQPGSPAHWKATVDEFFVDLTYLVDQTGPIDCVIVTGDVAYSGDHRQYQRATRFVNRLVSYLSDFNHSVSIIPVPGNHDVVRPSDMDPVVQLAARDSRFVADEIEQTLRSAAMNDYGSTIETAFRPFLEWSQTLTADGSDRMPGAAPGDAVVRISAGSLSLGVIALNTSLLHLSDTVSQGDLTLLDSQIDAVMKIEQTREPASTYILVTHHPRIWLDQRGISLLHDGLFAAMPISLHLFGHRHESEFSLLAPGADPHHRYDLQGKSFFGLEYLADGSTRRLHGYSVIRIEQSQDGLVMQVAPRQAVPRPAGGYTFACERGQAWYVPKESDWTEPLKLRSQLDIQEAVKGLAKKTRRLRTSEKWPTISQVSQFELAPFDELRMAVIDAIDPDIESSWRRIPKPITFLQNAAAVGTLTGNDIVPSLPELLYVWAVQLLSAARVEMAYQQHKTLTSLEREPDWSRDVVGTLSSFDRLVERSQDVSAAPRVRAGIDEWLVRRVLDRSSLTWRLSETRSIASKLAAILERRPSHIDALADRMLVDAQSVANRSVSAAKVHESWAYAYFSDRQLDHVRTSLILSLAMTLNALAFDLTQNGKEIVEQVGVVGNFDIAQVHADLNGLKWVPTSTEEAELLAECCDPAVEASLHKYVDDLRRLALHLPNCSESDVLRHRFLTRIKAPSITARRINGVPCYDRPITRLMMDSEKIRSLLMGEQLYGQARLAIRELYQNALDACRYRDLRCKYFEAVDHWPRAKWEGHIVFWAGYDENGLVTTFECRDNGVGMSRATLRDCFLSAGTKFVETASFAEEQAEWLRVDESLRLVPNATFGIGAYSYFMLADVVEVITRPETADGRLGDSLRLQVNAGSSVARLSEYSEGNPKLPTGGTIVRLHLRREFRSVSKLQLGNFVDEVILRSPFEITIVEGNESRTRPANEISPEVSSPHHTAWSSEESTAWWRVGRGPLLADGIKTPERIVGIMASLHGAKKPVLRVDRNAVVKWDLEWVLEQTAASAEALAEWPNLSLAWLWNFSERYPVHGHRLFNELINICREVPVGQSRLWGRTVDLALVGCFPGDRYLVPELHDGRWQTEYPEIEIPRISQRRDRWYRHTVRFPSCLRPWRRRVWMEALPELFEGWDPDARSLSWSPTETVRSQEDLAFPVWEPERLHGLGNPDAIDAALIASQPELSSVSFWPIDAGHTAFVDVVALVHGAHRCEIGLGDALVRVSQFARFGLRGLPNLRSSSFSYVPTRHDCQLVASLGRAWPAYQQVRPADFLQLIPLSQEEGLSIGEAVESLKEILDRLGIVNQQPRAHAEWVSNVPSSREVRFFGFGEYDAGRELRYGRGTRGALIRGARRADMQSSEVSKLVRRYRYFEMDKYEKALTALRLSPDDDELLRAWSANFDSRPPWVDEEVFRRGFIGDQPSSVEELFGHAVFYSVLSGDTLRDAASRVFAFPGLSSEQRASCDHIPDVAADERDLEILRSRIGVMSSYQDKRFAGIGQRELVRRRWSVLELKAAANSTKAEMREILQRLGKFEFLGVELPNCTPEELEDYEFTDLDMALLTTEDRTLGAFDRFAGFNEHDKKPIIGPIPALHVMWVAATEKISLGQAMAALTALGRLGVESSASPLPKSLHTYVPARDEASLARRLARLSFGHGIVETAFQQRTTLSNVCDAIAPWCSWVLGRRTPIPTEEALQVVRDYCGSVVPTYSEVSFYAAAHAQANRNRNVLDSVLFIVLAAQANASVADAVEIAERLTGVFLADGIELEVDEALRVASHERPDSNWVIAAVPETVVGSGSSVIRALLGVSRGFVRRIARFVSYTEHDELPVPSPRAD